MEGFFDTLTDIMLAILDFLFSWVHFPKVPLEFENIIDNIFDFLFLNGGLLNFFVPFATLKIGIRIVVSMYILYILVRLFMYVFNLVVKVKTAI